MQKPKIKRAMRASRNKMYMYFVKWCDQLRTLTVASLSSTPTESKKAKKYTFIQSAGSRSDRNPLITCPVAIYFSAVIR